MSDDVIHQAADRIIQADSFLFAAGAGMGVDSGLPDFRGPEGFWQAYPAYRHLGLSFVDLANPAWFDDDPSLAWGFYGHRMHLYRNTEPHEGFQILRRWMDRAGSGFVFTSNVDGHFQKAGFQGDQIVECHGSIHHLQCARPCSRDIWPAAEISVEVDPESFRSKGTLPACRNCGGLARPNILMFGDWSWCQFRTGAQEGRFTRWLENSAGHRTVVIECGAGRAVPTVRYTCEQVVSRKDATLIRINPREPEGPRGTISISSGALEALAKIEDRIAKIL